MTLGKRKKERIVESNYLNSEIATKIMKWELLTVGYFGTKDETPRQRELVVWMDKIDIWEVGDYWIDIDIDFAIKADYWNPTNNIAQAWQVLEGFPADIYRVAIITYEYNEDTPGKATWECAINRHAYIYRIWSSIADTAPMAICLAALKTLEKE